MARALGPNAASERQTDVVRGRIDYDRLAAIRPGIDDHTAEQAADTILAAYESENLSEEAQRSLYRLARPAVKPVVEALRKQLGSDGVWQFRKEYFDVIESLGPLANAAAPTIEEAVEAEGNALVIQHALAALSAIEPADRSQAASTIDRVTSPEHWKHHPHSVAEIQQWGLTAKEKIGDDFTIARLISDLEVPIKPEAYRSLTCWGRWGHVPPARFRLSGRSWKRIPYHCSGESCRGFGSHGR